MGLERTFSIIKPDATRRNLTGKINVKFEEAGLRIVAQKRIHMTKKPLEAFVSLPVIYPFCKIERLILKLIKTNLKFIIF